MGKTCVVCKNKKSPFFEIPVNPVTRKKWLEYLNRIGVTNISERSVLCQDHFEESCFNRSYKICRLKYGAVPSLSLTKPSLSPNVLSIDDQIQEVYPAPTIPTHPSSEISLLKATCESLTLQLANANVRLAEYETLKSQLAEARKQIEHYESKIKGLERELQENRPVIECINKITQDAEGSNEKAVFLMDILKNYNLKSPRWSELSIRMCTVWRFCSPKGYEFGRKNLIKLPSKSTISRYLGEFRGQNELIKERLRAEISVLKKPVERLCSLIIDDMAIKEKMSYSRAEDKIYGLDTCSSSSVVGNKPKIANKMLCFVVHGLSTKFTIPCGYFFHKTLTLSDFYSITLKVLHQLTDCGFLVLRLVTDNAACNVSLFKKFGKGTVKHYVDHPFLPELPLFLSFDFCHAFKNARNLFLDHDMYSSQGKISCTYLKVLCDLQKGLPVKPVRFLTEKHLYPTNLEKMNVLRAIQLFSPTVTAALKLLKDSGDSRFQDVDATVSYLENMYHFFELHNVSNRLQYIKKLDSNIAPYVNISDERLHWLQITFQNYVDDIQCTSEKRAVRGLSAETAHALKFTAYSTYLTVKFLLQEAGFYYVLTRSFSSDPVEATFSHVRLKGGSHDATDARAADYAMRQILRCGIVKASLSANVTAEDTQFVSSGQLASCSSEKPKPREKVVLPEELKIKINNLQENNIPETNLYSASVAFLSGYIIMKIEKLLNCDECISPLLSTTLPGPLLKLILLQDHGGLTYPNEVFVGLIKRVTDIVQEVLPFLGYTNTCGELINLLYEPLIRNPLLICSAHKYELCKLLIIITAKPIIDNICLEQTEIVKRKVLNRKPLSRKVLKL